MAEGVSHPEVQRETREAPVAEKSTLGAVRQVVCACGCWGPEPWWRIACSVGSGSSALPGRHLLPGELWIEKSIMGMTVSDNT